MAITFEDVTPGLLGPAAWRALVGSWDAEYSYAHAAAMADHPFNDGAGGRTFWWLVRVDGSPLGLIPCFVTETLNLSIFAVEVMALLTRAFGPLYTSLERRDAFPRIRRTPLGGCIRLLSGRPRVLVVGTHLADVCGQPVGPRLRALPPAAYLPALVRELDAAARRFRADQILLRESPERDAGPFHFPNLWAAVDEQGRGILTRAGYRRMGGLPAGYLDLRRLHALDPTAGAIYERYRHDRVEDASAFIGELRAWLAQPEPDPARYPAVRAPASRLDRLRHQLERSGIVPGALVPVLARQRGEAVLVEWRALRGALDRRRRALLAREQELSRRLAAAGIPGHAADVYRRAARLAELGGVGSKRRAAPARATGTPADAAAPDGAARALLESNGGVLPSVIAVALDQTRPLAQRIATARAEIARREAAVRVKEAEWRRLLLDGDCDAAERDARARAHARFRREQDRLATVGFPGPPHSPAERRRRLEELLAYPAVPYRAVLRATDDLRAEDRRRMLREHERHRDRVRAVAPDQPGPEPPGFDDEGYLVHPLRFVPRDERVWTNLADQDQITWLYHLTMMRSAVHHEVVDWPYRVAYRAHGAGTGDELHLSTLRAGSEAGPIVAVVTVKRTAAGHVRPERIGIDGARFGAYHALATLVLAHEHEQGGTYHSLGPTSWGTKTREFGAAFTDAHEYTRFRGPFRRLLEFARWRTGVRIRFERLLEIAALPAEQVDEQARRAGIRWTV